MARMRWTHALECTSEEGKCNLSPAPLHSPRTRTHPVPTLSQSDTDGANTRDVSCIARERYLLAWWKPNAVNYTAWLHSHFSPREMAGQDKPVISQKQSIWKDDVPSTVRRHLPALWNGIIAGKLSGSQRLRGDVHVCMQVCGGPNTFNITCHSDRSVISPSHRFFYRLRFV